jgi:ribose transport system substrate-binding protein
VIEEDHARVLEERQREVPSRRRASWTSDHLEGPAQEDDLKNESTWSRLHRAGVNGICLALNDRAGAAGEGGEGANIPVVVFDSSLQGEEHVSYVATDNVAAGKLGGERLVKSLGGKGNVVLLRYLEGSASTNQREQGFMDALKAATDIKVVSDNQYGGATTESASSASESLLVAHGADKGELAGVFCPNESTTFGMLLALRKLGLAGKVKLVGFDASENSWPGDRRPHRR